MWFCWRIGISRGGALAIVIKSFDAVRDEHSRVLILGTAPGRESLDLEEYYAGRNNEFWPTIYSIFDLEPAETYPERKAFLLQKNIAIWDVARECTREGSSDRRLRNVSANNFTGVLDEPTNIKCVCFNGQKALSLFMGCIGLKWSSVSYILLPSTNGASSMHVELKKQFWKATLKPFLNTK